MKTRRKTKLSNSVFIGLLGILLGLTSAFGQSIYTSGHADIGVGYDNDAQTFMPHWHVGSGAIVDGQELTDSGEFAPTSLYAVVSAQRNSPSGLSTSIGLPDGSPIYAAGSSTYQPNLGLAVEELSYSNWIGDITLTLTDWTIPTGAEFSMYSTDITGTSVSDVVFSTFDPNTTYDSNSLPLVAGDHSHFEWGFTDPGFYEFELTWLGNHVTDGAITNSATFGFNVVPEPSTYVLIMLSVISAFVLARRSCRA